MLSLDLFKSRFETQLHEGAVDSVAEQDQDQPQDKIPNNINQFNTDDNRALVKRIWAQISQHAINDTAGWLTLEWPNQPAATLSRNQVWTVINKIAKMPATQRNAFALSTLGDRNAFLTWMNSLKIISRPAPKKEPPRGQQSLDLKEAEKKSSEDPKFKSTRLDRLKTQARARHPAAASDMEAMVADFVDQQDQDQTELNRVKDVNRRQDELLKQITDLNQTQDQEIDNLGSEEARLQQNLKQIQAANVTLAQKLAAMSQRRAKAEPVAQPEPQPVVGVSVATDKVAPDAVPAPAPTPPIDTRARQYAQALRRQLNQLQTMVALKAPEDQGQLKQDIEDLKAQLANLRQQEIVGQATVGGQQADVLNKSTADIKTQTSTDTETDDGVIDLTGIDKVLAPYRKPAKKSAKKKPKEQKPKFELTSEAQSVESIPLKSVVQGYTVEYNPNTKQVTVSRGGQVVGTGVNRLNSAKYHLTLVNRIIDRSEEDKYPTDIDVRDVALPMKRIAEELPAKAAKELHRWKNQQTQSTASTEVVSVEPQPVSTRLSDLQSKKQRIDNLASIKQDIEKLQARATRGGRMLPRGLAADLEDYFTTADIDTAYDEMMVKYQRQLGALQQYLGMRKALWSPRKDVHEMKAKELQEGGPETWTVHFTDGTTTRVRVPSDETDPAQVRAFFAKKGKTVKKFDYGFTTEPAAGPGPEPHEPGSGSAVSGRTGKELPEDALDRSGQKMYTAKEVYMLTHNGQEVAFYTLKDLKRAEQDAQDMQKKLGGEVHLRKVMREGEGSWKKETPWTKSTGKDPRGEVTHMSDVARRETEKMAKDSSPMGQLFKDFEKIFGKKPPVKEGDVVNINRGGYNAFRDRADWLDKRDYVQQQLLDPRQRDNYSELKQRLSDINSVGRELGYTK